MKSYINQKLIHYDSFLIHRILAIVHIWRRIRLKFHNLIDMQSIESWLFQIQFKKLILAFWRLC